MNRIFVASEAYDGLFLPDEKEELNTFFTTFANPENYPIYYHCRGGADRTGSYSFILGALYGMSLNDLFLEYELTSLSIWGTRVRNHKLFSKFLQSFLALPGEKYSDKARCFIKEKAGLSDAEIDKIYEIAVENK
jgi:protein-tyrosine phosphatase